MKKIRKRRIFKINKETKKTKTLIRKISQRITRKRETEATLIRKRKNKKKKKNYFYLDEEDSKTSIEYKNKLIPKIRKD